MTMPTRKITGVLCNYVMAWEHRSARLPSPVRLWCNGTRSMYSASILIDNDTTIKRRLSNDQIYRSRLTVQGDVIRTPELVGREKAQLTWMKAHGNQTASHSTVSVRAR